MLKKIFVTQAFSERLKLKLKGHISKGAYTLRLKPLEPFLIRKKFRDFQLRALKKIPTKRKIYITFDENKILIGSILNDQFTQIKLIHYSFKNCLDLETFIGSVYQKNKNFFDEPNLILKTKPVFRALLEKITKKRWGLLKEAFLDWEIEQTYFKDYKTILRYYFERKKYLNQNFYSSLQKAKSEGLLEKIYIDENLDLKAYQQLNQVPSLKIKYIKSCNKIKFLMPESFLIKLFY